MDYDLLMTSNFTPIILFKRTIAKNRSNGTQIHTTMA